MPAVKKSGKNWARKKNWQRSFAFISFEVHTTRKRKWMCVRPMKTNRCREEKKQEVTNSFLIKNQHQREIVFIYRAATFHFILVYFRWGASFVLFDIEKLACSKILLLLLLPGKILWLKREALNVPLAEIGESGHIFSPYDKRKCEFLANAVQIESCGHSLDFCL